MPNSGEGFSFQDADAALAEIERALERMMLLAQVSSSDLNVDREVLQRTLERLQEKIDRIADELAQAEDGQ